MGINNILPMEEISNQNDKPMKKISLNKLFGFIVILFIAMVLSSCDGDTSASRGQNENSENVNNSQFSEDDNEGKLLLEDYKVNEM